MQMKTVECEPFGVCVWRLAQTLIKCKHLNMAFISSYNILFFIVLVVCFNLFDFCAMERECW